MREELQDSMKRLVNFMNFTRSFFKRNKVKGTDYGINCLQFQNDVSHSV